MSVGGIMVKQILLVALALLLAACSQVAQPALVDNRPPSVVITGPGEGQVMAPNLVVRAVASSSRRIASVTYSLDGGVARTVGTQSQIEIPLQSLSDGVHQVRLTVRDEGGLETTATRSFVVDSTPQAAAIDVEIQPTQISYTVTITEEEDEDGNVTVNYNLEVVPVVISANARPGSLGVTLTSYTVDYFYGDGTPVPLPPNARFAGSINMRVLPGLICDDLFLGEDPALRECTVNSPGASFQMGPTVLSSSFFPLDPDTGYTMFFSLRPVEAAYAVISLSGVDDFNRPFSKVLEPITIMQSVVAN